MSVLKVTIVVVEDSSMVPKSVEVDASNLYPWVSVEKATGVQFTVTLVLNTSKTCSFVTGVARVAVERTVDVQSVGTLLLLRALTRK